MPVLSKISLQFSKFFFIEKLYRFKNIPLPNSNKPQVFWAFLGKKIGDRAIVAAPGGKSEYILIAVE